MILSNTHATSLFMEGARMMIC